MRKVLALILAAILALSVLAGCTSSGGGTDKTTAADDGGEVAQDAA